MNLWIHSLLKILTFSSFFVKTMKFRVQNNFIFLWRSSSWYVGGSCQLQHHCQRVEAFVQHAARRKWNLGKPWSDKALSVIPLEPEVYINCLLGHIDLIYFFFHVDSTYIYEVFLLTTLELICCVVWKSSSFHCSLESTKMVVLTFAQCFLFSQPRHAVKLLSVLNQMPQRHGPDTFFNFPGCSAAVSFQPKFYIIRKK